VHSRCDGSLCAARGEAACYRAMTLAPLVLLAALAAEPPTVAVIGPSTGSGARARLAVETAIADHGNLGTLPGDRWRAAVRDARVPAASATTDASIARVAPRAGADAVVVVSLRGTPRARTVRARLVDARGRELWSGTQPLVAGAMAPEGARAIADAVAAALLPGPEKATPGSESVAPPPPAPEPPPEAVPERPAAAAATPAAPRVPPLELPPPGAAQPLVRFEAGVPLTWRSASVTRVAEAPAEFTTGTPYVGILLDARVAPFRAWWTGKLPPWIEPLELDLAFSYRFLSSRGPVGGVDQSLGSSEQRFSLDLRYPWLLPTRTTVAARLGYAFHRFSIDQNDVLPTSSRSGVRLGLDAAHPFLPWLAGELGFRLYPFFGPGSEERAAFGPDQSSGLGYELLVGASGPLPRIYPGLGWRVTYDLLHFSDSFGANGGPSRDGSASYNAIVFSATFTR
jgi:hypothetical protein